MQVRQSPSRAPEADPADVYSATTQLISISMQRKSASFCRTLIQQSREYLVTIHKEMWRHKLDLLEGELEYSRGNFQTAYPYFLDGWHYYQRSPDYPAFMGTTHVQLLCKGAFRIRDKTALHRWVHAIEGLTKQTGRDKLFTKRAHLYLLRAEHTLGANFSIASEWALDALASLGMMEMKEFETLTDCLRVLILARRWEEVDHRLSRHTVEDDFENHYFLGDERLARARHALGLDMQDDEYDTEFPLPLQPGLTADTERAAQYLRESQSHYEQAQTHAKTEDKRLETQWYTTTITERLHRLAALQAFAVFGKEHSTGETDA